MKFLPTFIFIFLSIFFLPTGLSGQSITGQWKTISDETGEVKSVVSIYQDDDGSYYGKIVELFRQPDEDPDPICIECDEDDPRYNQKIMGMVIINSLEKDGKYFTDGDILDPENGNVYRCKIWREGEGKLMVRGYLGPFYRTQEWFRTE